MIKKIVVTGIGCINALGNNAEQFSTQLFNGYHGISPITLFDKELVTAQQVAEVKNYSADDHFNDKKHLNFLDRFSQFAVISAREAIAQSGLQPNQLKDNASITIGSGSGGQTTLDNTYQRIYEQKVRRLPPFLLPKLTPSSAASHVSIDLGITGPSMGITSACSSSGHAISVGIMMLLSNQSEISVCGGSEAPLTLGTVKVWEAMRILAHDTCRPFSKNRGGVILGEGAATLVLETEEHAKKRGATILAELAGFGMSSDAYHVVTPSVDGPVAAMNTALKSANIEPSDIDYINAHGSGTEKNDSVETQAIHQLFKNHAPNLAVSSTKSMHGHTLGSASSIEAIASIAALQQQTAPATINYLESDPLCDLDYVTNEARKMDIEYAMSNSFAFGGLNVSLIFKRKQK